MEKESKVIVLGANGQPVGNLGQLRGRDSILLGKANGDYMNCTRESVEKLQQEKAERLSKYRKERGCDLIASDLIPIRLAGFENPYDELHNLLLQAYNNTLAANAALLSSVKQQKEINQLYQKISRERTAKDLACEFIQSIGCTEQFRRFCEERAGCQPYSPAVQYEVKRFIE